MNLRNSVIGWLVTAVVMALAWTVMDMPIASGISDNFMGKLVVSLVIIILSKIISAMLGSK